jgi:hypothetical protein
MEVDTGRSDHDTFALVGNQLVFAVARPAPRISEREVSFNTSPGQIESFALPEARKVKSFREADTTRIDDTYLGTRGYQRVTEPLRHRCGDLTVSRQFAVSSLTGNPFAKSAPVGLFYP